MKSPATRQIFSISLLALTGIVLVYSLFDYIDALLGAIMLYIMCRPAMIYLSVKKDWKRSRAAMVIVLGSILALAGILWLMTEFFVPPLVQLFTKPDTIDLLVNKVEPFVKETTGIDLLDTTWLSQFSGNIATIAAGLLNSSLSILADLGMMILFLYFMLINFGSMEKEITKFLPFNKARIRSFRDELFAQTYSNILGAPLLALMQSVVATIGYLIAGIPDPVFWGALTGIFSFLPVVGSALIWIPASLYLLADGDTTWFIFLLTYGVVVISMVDNVFRFMFQKKFAAVHPLITVLGVITGINYFGVPGILFGPLLISYFLILVRMYEQDFLNKEEGEGDA